MSEHTETQNGILNADQQTLITEKDVERITKLSRHTIYRTCDAGEFPKPIKVRRRRLYLKSEINEWLKARLAER